MSNNNSNNVGIEWEIEVAFSSLIGHSQLWQN